MKLRQKQEHAELIDLDMKSKAHIEQMNANFERERQVSLLPVLLSSRWPSDI